jgi:hypothetical protein
LKKKGGLDMRETMLEDKIRKHVLEEFKSISSSPDKKQEIWERIQKDLGSKTSKNNRRYVWVASFLLILTALLIYQPGNVSAFDWFVNILYRIQGTSTELVGKVGGPSDSTSERPKPDIQFTGSNFITKELSIKEAADLTVFDIIEPKYLPRGFSFSKAVIQHIEGEKSSKATLHYKSNDQMILIKQIYVLDQRGYSLVFDNEDTMIKKIKINDYESQLIEFKNGEKILSWTAANIQYVISTTISEKEIIQIGESM